MRMSTSPLIWPRVDSESVVLANCVDPDGTASSQMAYFSGAPGPSPQDVAVVSTPVGQTALWVNSVTSALFTDTGVTFTASLGREGTNGEYAGSGNNGYGSFSCWQDYASDLYTYDNTIICSQVYDCNHNPVPANATTGATPTSSPSSTPTHSATAAPASSGGVSTEVTIAAGVGGAAAGVVALTALTIFLFRWRGRRRKQSIASGESVRRGPSSVSDRRAVFPAEKPVERQTPFSELDGYWHGVELGGDVRYEMGNDRRPELDAAMNHGWSPVAGDPGLMVSSPSPYERAREFEAPMNPTTLHSSESAD